MITRDTYLDRFFIGIDTLIDKIPSTADMTAKFVASTYPPYNIKKIDDNKYVIEMAIAGFTKNDVEIELNGSELTIKGSVKSGEPSERMSSGEMTWPAMIYQGLAMRSFVKNFHLADEIVIQRAEMLNGILRVALENVVNTTSPTVKIDIDDIAEKKGK